MHRNTEVSIMLVSCCSMDDKMYIGAYNTWDQRGRLSLRPQDEHCLMRNMTSEILCSACKEAIWLNFLRYRRMLCRC